MKVLLLRPVTETFNVSPPLGLGYLATALRRNNFQVSILDCPKEKMSFNDYEEHIQKYDYDLLGIQVWSLEIPIVERTLALIKKIKPKTVTVIGGAHPSGLPYEVLDELPDADYAFRGEGEVGFPMLIRQLKKRKKNLEKIPGLIWRERNNIKVNKPLFVTDLDQLGFPAWDLINPNEYPEAPHGGFSKNSPVAPVVISRGCPYNCTFCGGKTITGTKIRYRSVDNVIEEIKLLKENYGVKEIHIDDDNFTHNRQLVIDFCNALIDNRLDISWFCASGIRLDSIDKEILKLMKRAGCYTITVAVESGSQKVLDHMQKRFTLEQVKQQVKVLREVGFETAGLFILGYPTETLSDIKKTIKLALKLDLQRAQFANFLPVPGTPIYRYLKEKGELEDLDYSKLHTADTPYSPPGITERQLKNLQRYAFMKFYSRPKIIWHTLRKINSLDHIKFLMIRGLEYFFRR